MVEANREARAVLPALRNGQPLAFALRDPGVLATVAAVASDGADATVEFGGLTSGEPVWEVRFRRLPGGGEEALGKAAVALFLRDMTAERRTETMRVDFVANVSHELRTPLATLSGFIETLRGPARDDEPARARFLGIMAAQADRMTRLVNDLLQLSRVELSEHRRPSGRVDLADAVRHMLDVLAPRARERSVTLLTDLPDGPLTVTGERDEILRLVENLVENALRYGEGAPVTVTVRRVETGHGFPAGGAELVVRDSGPGIPAEHLPRLTERFYRVDPAHSRGTGGTGLGLAIVKHIVGRHRGRLSIESRPGEGASFSVTLPLAPS